MAEKNCHEDSNKYCNTIIKNTKYPNIIRRLIRQSERKSINNMINRCVMHNGINRKVMPIPTAPTIRKSKRNSNLSCPHMHRKYYCKICDGREGCQHKNNKYRCSICSPHNFCVHGRYHTTCRVCRERLPR
jgi:hypothetical protein